ncbi:50S ribosomal protein L30 [candidate division KSB1 bacterium]|nr:50S ribosomal protein L30 [candidate division KSB1 bacterium]NIR70224.1 50S ribosomal protein L30 [candidate division KSB1 bacterium]NIS26495.1 50S ribosomal protein L30 [candidate division KSB1 bacterium]NIT73257.1 50S ribosomal protein L30 [candidate division KSB1 bacterium]NIU23881.1 50S ribosomal protein L30 [candidate division KSB1 bacterium]
MAKKKQIKITQTRSTIGRTPKQRKTIKALGLKRLHHTVTHNDTAQIRGMINKVNHLVNVEES